MRVYINGVFQDLSQAAFDPRDRGLRLGDGLFETIRVVGGEIRHLDQHVARLTSAAKVIGLPLPEDIGRVDTIIAEVLAANGIGDAAVRVTVTRGPAPRDLAPPSDPEPSVLVAASLHSRPQVLERVTARIATVTRRNDLSPLSCLKSLGYLDNVLALAEARRQGADEAFLLNTQGRLACASAANIFAVIDGRLVTPPVSEGVLPGTARARVLAALDVEEGLLAPEELSRATEVFLTNALSVRGVAAVEGVNAHLETGPTTHHAWSAVLD